MRGALLVVLAAATLAAPHAAGTGSFGAAAEPSSVEAPAGFDARANFTFSNGLDHDINVTLSYAADRDVRVDYARWTLTVPAHGSVGVPARLHVAPNATPGEIAVTLLAQDLGHSLPEIRAPLTLRILPPPALPRAPGGALTVPAQLAPPPAATAGPQTLRVTPEDVSLQEGGEAIVHLFFANKGAAPWAPRLLFELPAGVSATPSSPPGILAPGATEDIPLRLRAAGATTGDAEARVLASPVAAPLHLHVTTAATSAAPSGNGGTARTVLGVGAASAGAVGICVGLRKRWPFVAAALYSRLAPNKVLDQPTRQHIADFVHDRPGVAFGDLARAWDLGAGALTYHARVLERAGVIFSVREGQQRVFYPVAGGRVAGAPSLGERAAAALRAGPRGVADLARELDVSKQALHYHLKRMARDGQVRVEGSGRALRYALG